MPDLSQLTRERLVADMLTWLTAIIALWAGSSIIRKGVAAILGQLYDFFIGKTVP